ncbi:putative multi-domain containing protein, partial [Aduncisulcus paluster]
HADHPAVSTDKQAKPHASCDLSEFLLPSDIPSPLAILSQESAASIILRCLIIISTDRIHSRMPEEKEPTSPTYPLIASSDPLLVSLKAEPFPEELTKDHPLSVMLACAFSSLRSIIFHISPKSPFYTISLVSKIVPSIASTNAIVGGICVCNICECVCSMGRIEGNPLLHDGASSITRIDWEGHSDSSLLTFPSTFLSSSSSSFPLFRDRGQRKIGCSVCGSDLIVALCAIHMPTPSDGSLSPSSSLFSAPIPHNVDIYDLMCRVVTAVSGSEQHGSLSQTDPYEWTVMNESGTSWCGLCTFNEDTKTWGCELVEEEESEDSLDALMKEEEGEEGEEDLESKSGEESSRMVAVPCKLLLSMTLPSTNGEPVEIDLDIQPNAVDDVLVRLLSVEERKVVEEKKKEEKERLEKLEQERQAKMELIKKSMEKMREGDGGEIVDLSDDEEQSIDECLSIEYQIEHSLSLGDSPMRKQTDKGELNLKKLEAFLDKKKSLKKIEFVEFECIQFQKVLKPEKLSKILWKVVNTYYKHFGLSLQIREGSQSIYYGNLTKKWHLIHRNPSEECQRSAPVINRNLLELLEILQEEFRNNPDLKFHRKDESMSIKKDGMFDSPQTPPLSKSPKVTAIKSQFIDLPRKIKSDTIRISSSKFADASTAPPQQVSKSQQITPLYDKVSASTNHQYDVVEPPIVNGQEIPHTPKPSVTLLSESKDDIEQVIPFEAKEKEAEEEAEEEEEEEESDRTSISVYEFPPSPIEDRVLKIVHNHTSMMEKQKQTQLSDVKSHEYMMKGMVYDMLKEIEKEVFDHFCLEEKK